MIATTIAARRRKGIAKQLGIFDGSAFENNGFEVKTVMVEPDKKLHGVVSAIDSIDLLTLVSRVEEQSRYQVIMHMALPGSNFGPPVVKFLSPNGVFEVDQTICIDGFTHYHPDSWNPCMQLNSLLTALVAPLVFEDSRRDIVGGIGVILRKGADSSHVLVGDLDGRSYNARHRADVLEMFKMGASPP